MIVKLPEKHSANAMETINRSAVTVIPAKRFLDWLHRVDPTSVELSLEDLSQEATIYLLPEYDTDEEALGHLRNHCGEIFEEELDGWYGVPSAWPVDRSFDNFVRWFEYSFHSVLVDLGHQTLKHDEI
jgi:hypothetical protein